MFLVMEVRLQANRFDSQSAGRAEIAVEGELSTLAAMPYGMSESLSAAANEMIRKLEAELSAAPAPAEEE